MRADEFAAAAGDWAFHCHRSHHTMNAMGHDVPTMIGVDHRGVAERISKLVPDRMVTGERGMADMGAMETPLPRNTLPTMLRRSRPARAGWQGFRRGSAVALPRGSAETPSKDTCPLPKSCACRRSAPMPSVSPCRACRPPR
jgi:hypothetical protein